MEDKSPQIVGIGTLPEGTPGDVPVVELGVNEVETAVLRKAAKVSGKMWLSQVLGKGDWSPLVTPGTPEARKWKNIVIEGLKRRRGEG